MGLSRRTRALVALAVAVPAFAASTATAATLNEPVLGSRAIEPIIDRNAPGQIEAFDFVAKSDGPVDVVNVYLDRYAGTPNLSRPNARLHAGIYANGSNNRPGKRRAARLVHPGQWHRIIELKLETGSLHGCRR